MIPHQRPNSRNTITPKSLQFYKNAIEMGDTDTFINNLPPPPPASPSHATNHSSSSKLRSQKTRRQQNTVTTLPLFPSHNYTLMHYAALHGRFKILQHLIEHQYYDVNLEDSLGNTVLLEACRRDSFQNVDCVAQLVALSAQQDDDLVESSSGSSSNNNEGSSSPRSQGGDDASEARKRTSSLHRDSIMSSHSSTASHREPTPEYMRVNLFHKNKRNQNALHVACAQQKCHLHYYQDRKTCAFEKFCSLLLKARGGRKFLDESDGMHLYYAVKNEHRSIVKLFLNPSHLFLMERMSNFTPCTFDCEAHGALRNCETKEMASILVEQGKANVEATDSRGRTPLHEAAQTGRASVCQYLLKECKADANVIDDEGKTALFLCCQHLSNVDPEAKWIDTIQVLLNHGASLNRPDLEFELTPLEYLQEFKKNIKEGKEAIKLMTQVVEEREGIQRNLFSRFALKDIVR